MRERDGGYVASFDGGFGSAYLARQVGQKFAREIFFLGSEYSADDAHRMGMVNSVVPHADPNYEKLRPKLKIDKKNLVKVSDTLGLHH